jgi:hypothetical protein
MDDVCGIGFEPGAKPIEALIEVAPDRDRIPYARNQHDQRQDQERRDDHDG